MVMVRVRVKMVVNGGLILYLTYMDGFVWVAKCADEQAYVNDAVVEMHSHQKLIGI